MTGFWILAALVGVVTVAIIGRALLTGRGAAAASAAYDIQVYRDQLKELERDVARGVIAAPEAERAKVEISRRLLEADRKARAGDRAGDAPRWATATAFGLSAAVILGGGYFLYADMGAPGYWDMPLEGRFEAAETARETRRTQAEIEAALPDWDGPPAEAPADYLELVEKLRAAVADNPDDLEGQRLLAQHEASLGNHRAAHAAMRRAIALLGPSATADNYAQYADLLVMAAAGEVSPEAEAAVRSALAREPGNEVARYYLGLMHAQTGRPDLAFPLWRDLLENAGPEDLYVAPIRMQIRQLAAFAGVDYTLPPPPQATPGLSAEDIAAAEDMTPEERAEMVDTMVAQLMERLATEGGTAPEWAQLIGALGVQGNLDRAQMIFEEGRTVFAGRPQDLALINDAAARAGLEVDGAATAGPSAEDIDAASEMSEEDRAAMIDGMVSRLYDSLLEDGGPVARWEQLFTALAVQEDAARATAAWQAAQAAFADDPAALDRLRAAATAAGAGE